MLGRKNCLFIGDIDAGTNIAGLCTLVATCEKRGVNRFAFPPTSSLGCRTIPLIGATTCSRVPLGRYVAGIIQRTVLLRGVHQGGPFRPMRWRRNFRRHT
jgi:hypothetical protein